MNLLLMRSMVSLTIKTTQLEDKYEESELEAVTTEDDSEEPSGPDRWF